MVLWTAFASCFSLMLGYSRIPFAAARDGNFFKIFGRLHPRKEFPHISLLFVGGLSILCSFLPLLTVIDALLTTRILVQFIGQIAAVIWLRRRAPDMERPFRIWLYPVPVLIALLGWIFLLVTTSRMTLAYAGATLFAGVLFFLGWSRWTRRWPFEAPDTAA
jgi:amino acid transporter